MTTLNQWIAEHEFHLDDEDLEFLSDVVDEEGFAAECSDADWSLFIGPRFVVHNDVQGTRRCDNEDLYAIQSWPTHVEVRDTTGAGDGIEAERLYEEVANALDVGCNTVILVQSQRCRLGNK